MTTKHGIHQSAWILQTAVESKMRIKTLVQYSITALLLFSAAWLIHAEMKQFTVQEFVTQFSAYSHWRIALAFTLTGLCYLLLTSYDFFALRYVHRPLSMWKTVFTSLTCFAFSNNISFGNLTAVALRFRIYSEWGVDGKDVLKIVLFHLTTSWLGFFATAGLVFTFFPPALPATVPVPEIFLRSLGILFLLLLAFSLWWAASRSGPIRFRRWTLTLPHNRELAIQVFLAAADWFITGIVPFLLLSIGGAQLSYSNFLGVYLLAQLLGMISHVPAQLGVFDGVMLHLLSNQLPTPNILAALLVYRGIYFLVPLFLGSASLLGFEVYRKRKASEPT